jgi:hypothetical protein
MGLLRSIFGRKEPSAALTVITKPGPANDTAAKAALEIGAVARAGDHKGEIYGGILPDDNKPIWFLAAPKSMDHFNAASWATKQGGALPTREQGDYLTTLKGKGGAFTELFNRGSSFPAGYVWLAGAVTNLDSHSWRQMLTDGLDWLFPHYRFKTNYRYNAECQRLSDGDQHGCGERYDELPVLCVRR